MSDGTDPLVGDPVAAWAASGAMALTGHADGPPLSPAAAVVPALVALGDDLGLPADVGELLTGRAAALGLTRRGRISASGSCRLLPTADGWAAVNLARPSDVESVGALVERTVDGDPWTVLARAAERMAGDDLVARAALLAIPAAVLPTAPPSAPRSPGRGRAGPASHAPAGGPRPAPFTLRRLAPARPEPPTIDVAETRRPTPGPREDTTEPAPRQTGPGELVAAGGVANGRGRPLVVDLSAMWAGPLCARLLGLAGLRIVKVESTGRPDGARAGSARFFDWLHGGHGSVALDLGSAGGRAALARLVATADVVVESSRPRALAQLGIDAEAVVAARPGVTWVAITGHGREDDAAQRVAFGDDAAVAAGLVAYDGEGLPVFCGDAIADPITGLSAAVGALASIAAGGGHLVDVPMVGAVAAACAAPAPPATADPAPDGRWSVTTISGTHPVAPPHPLAVPPHPARPLGADTAHVLGPLDSPDGVRC